MDSNASCLPVLSSSDVEGAAQLILNAYASQAHLSPEDQKRIQQELFDIQKRPEAWGLVVPFLGHPDQNVQFFGAHTAQVKIARDWESFPQDNAVQLRDLLVELTAAAVVSGKSRVILNKLYVAVTSLALRLAPTGQWPDWIVNTASVLSNRGGTKESVLNFLAITSQEFERADLVGPNRGRIKQSFLDAAPAVVQAITSSLNSFIAQRQSSQAVLPSSINELDAALKCFQAWIPNLPTNEITPMIPLLIALITPITTVANTDASFEEDYFIPASDALQEIISGSPLADGAGAKTLTEPLLLWIEAWGGRVIQNTLEAGSVDAVSHSFCKLLTALGDHSTEYFATYIASDAHPSPIPPPPQPASLPTKGQLVQTFLKCALAYTALPGYFGVDEEESDIIIGFWYLFQEALWNTEFDFETDRSENPDTSVGKSSQEADQWQVGKAVYVELVRALRQKAKWPEASVLATWPKDVQDKFNIYRRDIGDTLINAYYVLRDDMMAYYVGDVADRLSNHRPGKGWEDIEADLHSIMCIQEAVPMEENVHLSRLFSADILGHLPSTGPDRVRQTMLRLIGTYASWFTTEPLATPGLTGTSSLMNAVTYTVSGLTERSLCFNAANALRDLCDANRSALAPHMNAFAQLNASIINMPNSEQIKILQSIASVIQALHPMEQIPHVDGLISPIISKLLELLAAPTNTPVTDAQEAIVDHLHALTAVAKGLTKATDPLHSLDEGPTSKEEMERMEAARRVPRMLQIRELLLTALRATVDAWSKDASVSDALSDLFKSITTLELDLTVISLPPSPLLELVCHAAQIQLTAVWLSLGGILMVQLNPPSLLPTLKPAPSADAQSIVASALPIILKTSLETLGQPKAMEDNPDVVQAFFGCMEKVSLHFTAAFYRLPHGVLDALVQCATQALALQERYSLVAAANFLGSIVSRTSTSDELSEQKDIIPRTHARPVLRAILCGVAGVAPRSCMPNLIELLSTLLTRWTRECKTLIPQVMLASDFVPSKASPEAKERFAKAIIGNRSLKRVRDAAQQFTLIARGLEGSSFGHATVTM